MLKKIWMVLMSQTILDMFCKIYFKLNYYYKNDIGQN